MKSKMRRKSIINTKSVLYLLIYLEIRDKLPVKKEKIR